MTPDDLGVRHAYADVNGMRMHYVEKGSGPLVVLLHGFPEMWWSWRYQIQALADAGYRAVAPDLRGYNETEAKGPYDLDTLRDDVAALIDHLCGGRAGRAIVVAHDWGGPVAWHLAASRPERVERLVVMNGPHPALMLKALLRKWSQIKRSWYIFFFQVPVLPERMITARGGQGAVRVLRSMAIDKTHFGDAEMAPFAEAVCKPGRATAMVDWYRTALRAGLRAGPKGPPGAGATITAPTLLIWAMDDAALGYDDVVVGIERYVPGIEIGKIEGCGHFVQQEKPEKVSEMLIEFLKRGSR
jgi:pimeloyl-ACP methyl ester carboxylesterase